MKWFVDIARVFRREMSLIVSDMGVMIFFVLLPLAYPIVYTLIYNPEVVRDVPVVVVDDSRTPQSRELVRQASAAPAFGLYGYASDMTEAKRLWADHKVYAIMHIPSDYAKDIARGEQAHVTMFCDMSLLLRYRSLLSAMTSLQIKLAEDITEERIELYAGTFAGMAGLPVESENHFLGDTQQGFASFVIPGIVVLILQQSMLLGIGMLGGSSRERRHANG
ncbi:MAG: ABC transporter permease, partial [Muribaculaceae bacterium]|nr:ABC transporter permease [Muribaculaceae bacterium]